MRDIEGTGLQPGGWPYFLLRVRVTFKRLIKGPERVFCAFCCNGKSARASLVEAFFAIFTSDELPTHSQRTSADRGKN
jgi:hypothetical protein